jgi:hypothetical protein
MKIDILAEEWESLLLYAIGSPVRFTYLASDVIIRKHLTKLTSTTSYKV